jgi:hypothetical protein
VDKRERGPHLLYAPRYDADLPKETAVNNQEREIISDIFKRLEQVADQPRDPETERFIAEKLRQQPYAPYAMAQAIYVQEQALTNLHQQVQQLEAELEESRSRPRQSGGLLGSLFGGGAREPEPRRGAGGGFGQPQYGAQPGMGGQGGPWGGQGGGQGGSQGQGGPWGGAQGGMMGGQQGGFGAPQRGGSGFLGTAMMTAAGVAGGMMLGNALTSAFGGGSSGAAAQGLSGGGDGAAGAAGNHSDLSPFGDSGAGGAQNAAYEPSEDFGGDFGGDAGGDDWA